MRKLVKCKKHYNVFNLLGFRPILYFIGCHGKSAQREDVTYICDGLDMEETLTGAGVWVMLSEVAEYLMDMPYMLFFRGGIDEDVI